MGWRADGPLVATSLKPSCSCLVAAFEDTDNSEFNAELTICVIRIDFFFGYGVESISKGSTMRPVRLFSLLMISWGCWLLFFMSPFVGDTSPLAGILLIGMGLLVYKLDRHREKPRNRFLPKDRVASKTPQLKSLSEGDGEDQALSSELPSKTQQPHRIQRRLRFGSRSLLIVITIFCVSIGWYVHRAQSQKKGVRCILRYGGTVHYDYERFDSNQVPIANTKPPGPKWLQNILGVDYFSNIVTANLNGTKVRDLIPLGGLKRLEYLDVSNTRVRDLSPLSGLKNLRYLSLQNTPIDDVTPLAGLKRLEYLNLSGSHVVNVRPLAGLTKLKTLSFSKPSQLHPSERKQWDRFTSDDGKVSVLFPGPPKILSETLDSANGKLDVNKTSYQFEDGEFIIIHLNLPCEPYQNRIGVSADLNGFCEGFAQNMNGKILETDDITISESQGSSGLPGKSILVRGRQNLYARARIYIVPESAVLVRAVCAGPLDFVNGPRAKFFFDSLAINY